MNYKIEKPEGTPEWFTPGIVCEVSNYNNFRYQFPLPVIWFFDGSFLTINSGGYVERWAHAKPVEWWVPEDKEVVVSVFHLWDDETFPFVAPFSEVMDGFIIYRYTDKVHEAIKAGTLSVGWLLEHGEKYEP